MTAKGAQSDALHIQRLVELSISTLVFLFDWARDFVVKPFGGKPRVRSVILYYHGVTANQRERFARQMDLLRRRAQPISCTGSPPLESTNRCAGITFDDGFLSFKEVALPELEVRGLPSTVFVPTLYLGIAPGWLPDSPERLMTPSELKEIAQSGFVTIGSHGISHRPFTDLLPEEADHELRESKRVLESVIGKEVVLFSFPHGALCEEHVPMARKVGYQRAFSIRPGCVFETPGEYLLGRVHADPSDWAAEFILKIAGAYRWLPFAHRVKRLGAILTKRRSAHGGSGDRDRATTVGERPW